MEPPPLPHPWAGGGGGEGSDRVSTPNMKPPGDRGLISGAVQ